MKEKAIKALKIILIIFGVLFLIQILLFGLMMLGIFGISSAETFDFDFDKFDKVRTSSKPKELLPVIKYAENYYNDNKKYPEKIENVKIKPEYKYEVTKDGNCYTITVKEKSQTKQYQHCKMISDNSSSVLESYAESSK